MAATWFGKRQIGISFLLIVILLQLRLAQAQSSVASLNIIPINSSAGSELPPLISPLNQTSSLTATNLITGTWYTGYERSLELPGDIWRIFVDEQDRLYIHGEFDWIEGETIKQFASWDGATWQDYGLTDDDKLAINTLKLYHGELVIGGFFRQIGGRTMNSLARWDGTQFQPFGNGLIHNPTLIGEVHDLAVISDSLQIGGNFASFDNVPAEAFAYWNPTSYGQIAKVIDRVYDIASTTNATIVAGLITSINDMPINQFALLQNQTWSQLPMPAGITTVKGLEVLNNTMYLITPAPNQSSHTMVHQWANNTWISDTSVITDSMAGWTVGNGTLYAANYVDSKSIWQRSNDGWHKLNLPVTIRRLNSIAGNSTGVYAAGSFIINGQPSNLFHWDGQNVTNIPQIMRHTPINQIGDLAGKPIIQDYKLQLWTENHWKTLYSTNSGLITTPTRTYLVEGYSIAPVPPIHSAIWHFLPNGTLTTSLVLTDAPNQLNFIHLNASMGQVWLNTQKALANNQEISGVFKVNDSGLQKITPISCRGMVYPTNRRLYCIVSYYPSTHNDIYYWNGQFWQFLSSHYTIDSERPLQAIAWRDHLYFTHGNELRRYDDGPTTVVATFDGKLHLLRAIGTPYLYITGRFTQINNQSIERIARWDGNDWQGFTTVPNGDIETMVVTNDVIHVSGKFTHVGPISSFGIASVDLTPYMIYLPSINK
ncbi:hypothetical protein [Herpetosiphon llansteffanensis]|uniref:hypothetical protein n=1 Tax=Herpetosiphon llansteffanensis TaxID=2094568 RepID=UPI000D7C409B|nr:hypothetical protein [Herpetosiphon llansteffanensis]